LIATLPEGISSTVFSLKFAMINPPKKSRVNPRNSGAK